MIAKTIARENIAVSNAAVTLTATNITPQVIYARVQVQVAPIRITEDGTTPNPSGPTGEIHYPANTFEIWGSQALKNFKMIRETTTDAAVEVTYYGQGG